jgi:transmembrane sensor
MSHADDIENQAATWLSRRDALGEDAQILELTTWLAADPRHRAAYLRLAAAWERTVQLKRLAPEGGTIDADLLKSGSTRSLSLWRPPLALAACVIAVAAAAALWWGGMHRDGQTYRTDIGGLSRVVLNDGSTVTLNTDTELRVHLSRVRREVQLLRGEAQFNVAHDAARPFEVLAEGRLVRAVGTAFDVRLDHGESLEVMVTEGSVAFLKTPGVQAAAPPSGTATPPENLPPDNIATISAGETAVATGGEVTVRRVSAAETSRQLAWQIGELSFQGETLSQAVAEFNRYNRRKLVVEDPSIRNLQIGGNFQALDVDSFVAALGRSFGIRTATADDGTRILEHAPSPGRD